jgi:hypothetical protein
MEDSISQGSGADIISIGYVAVIFFTSAITEIVDHVIDSARVIVIARHADHAIIVFNNGK